jgi:hypothetical protein
MAVGDNIKVAHQAVGLTFTIMRDTGNISGEYCIIKQNRQVTKPFIREFFQEARFGYDSQVIAGDLILTSDGRYMMVMNLTPKTLMNETIEKESVLYKCNVSGQLLRYSGEQTWDDDYELKAETLVVRENCYGLLTEALYGNELEEDEELGNLGLSSNELYVPASYSVYPHDRYKISDNEYYRIETIAKRKYDNINVAIVGEDNR